LSDNVVMADGQRQLAKLAANELDQPVDPRVSDVAAYIASQHGSARAVLFYGSCLRHSQLDGLMLDFYLIVDDYRSAYSKRWLAFANRLLPPNVFPIETKGIAAKYAVLSQADFARLASARTRNVSVWARFAQPSRLVWVRDAVCRRETVMAVAKAAPALLSAARPMLPQEVEPPDLWRGAFALTYSAELRAERTERGQSVVDAEPARYLAFTLPALSAAAIDLTAPVTDDQRRVARLAWRRRRIEGKMLTLLRLAKASLTFAGGIDYLAWKINRHAGTQIAIRNWQRRWPIMGAIILLPHLLKRGAVR
jgi:hypothetical protein